MEDRTTTAVATTTIACIECGRPWMHASERWRVKLLADEQPEAVPYCPDCHRREFEGS